jgi:hypothetical protein
LKDVASALRAPNDDSARIRHAPRGEKETAWFWIWKFEPIFFRKSRTPSGFFFEFRTPQSEPRPQEESGEECGREKSRVRIEAPRTAQKLLGQNPRKNNLCISGSAGMKFLLKKKRVFFLSGLLAYSPAHAISSFRHGSA